MGRITDWLLARRAEWRRAREVAVANELAADLKLDPAAVLRVMDNVHAQADAAYVTGDGNPHAIVAAAWRDLQRLLPDEDPADQAVFNRHVDEIPEPHRAILRAYLGGESRERIAASRCADERSISQSLVKSYAGLRLKLQRSRT